MKPPNYFKENLQLCRYFVNFALTKRSLHIIYIGANCSIRSSSHRRDSPHCAIWIKCKPPACECRRLLKMLTLNLVLCKKTKCEPSSRRSMCYFFSSLSSSSFSSGWMKPMGFRGFKVAICDLEDCSSARAVLMASSWARVLSLMSF